MHGSHISDLAASVCGGLAVAGAFIVLGVTGRHTIQTVVREAPESSSLPVSSRARALTAHAIYLRDAPGVAFIRATVIRPRPSPFDPYPQGDQGTSTGSGFLVSSRGYVLTNYHVVEGADPRGGVIVQFENGRGRRAAVIEQDESDDLALLKVGMDGLPPSVRPLTLGDSSTVRVGDPTLAIGNPYGLDRTLTSGIISALQRQIRAPNGFAIDNVIQTDAPINPGNSGGPLLDGAGRVIGINSQMVTGGDSDGGSVGIGFAIPIDTARAFLPWLGGRAPVAPEAAPARAAAVARVRSAAIARLRNAAIGGVRTGAVDRGRLADAARDR